MKNLALLAVMLSGLWMTTLTGPAYAQECPPGTSKVGEREEETPDAIIVHPVCRREQAPTASPPTGHAPFSLLSAESQGSVVLTTHDGRKVAGADAAKAPLDIGTRVVTGPTGRLRMVLPDETTFTIGPNSDLVLDEFVWDPDTSVSGMSIRLAKGLLRFVTGKVVKKVHDVRLRLPLVSLGFRGTEAECAVAPDGSGYVKLFSGEGEVTPTAGGTTIVLMAGQMIMLGASGKISPPFPIRP